MSPTILKRKENLPVNLNKLVWVYWKLLGFSFILTDTRNVICTLHLWCPLDKGHKCLLAVLFMVFCFFVFASYFVILFLKYLFCCIWKVLILIFVFLFVHLLLFKLLFKFHLWIYIYICINCETSTEQEKKINKAKLP